MAKQRRDRVDSDRPLTAREILMRENVRASKPMPPEVTTALRTTRIVLHAEEPGFDPCQGFERVAKGTWELSTAHAVTDGYPVHTMKRLSPRAVKSKARGHLEPYRPLWQHHVYHPRSLPSQLGPALLTRKSGAKVRPCGIYNHDDRQPFIPDGFPWNAIGQVLVKPSVSGASEYSMGTGTLVGSRTVLTAGHLIPWGRPNPVIRFSAGFFEGESIHGPGGVSWVTEVLGYDYEGGERAGWDMAVMRLKNPLGDAIGGFSVRAYNSDWEDETWWTLVGYPVEIKVTLTPTGITSVKTYGALPTRQFGISVEDDDSDGDALENEHRGDVSDGMSGGPLFGTWPDGPYVIGTTSGLEIRKFAGITTEHNNVCAGGDALVNLVRYARQQWE